MNLITGSMDLVCRTCLIASNNMKSIFIGDEGDICKMLMACSGIPIHDHDGFPTYICSDCLNKVYIAYEFREQCKLSHKTLLSFMQTTKINGELNFDTDIGSYTPFDESNSSSAVDLKIEGVPEGSEPNDFYNQILEKHDDPDYGEYHNLEGNDIKTGSIDEKYVISSGSDIFIINFKNDNDEPNICSDSNEDEMSEYYKLKESEQNQVKLHQCFQCNRKFTSLDYLRRHKITHLNGKLYPCELCDRHFSRLDDKRRHMQKHLKIKPFKCDECQVAFTRSDNLLAHRRKMHDIQIPSQSEVCEICLKTFPTLQNLNFHIKVHLPGVSNWKCKFCEQMFNSKEERNNHQKIIHEILNEWICKLCNHNFDSKEDYKNHQKMMHSVEQPAIKEWICKFCEQKFYSKQDRNNHKKMMHISKEIYPCGHCDKRFTHLELKNRHMRQHLKVRPHKCDECGSRFTRRDNLGRHRENRHGKRGNRNIARENKKETQSLNNEIFEDSIN